MIQQSLHDAVQGTIVSDVTTLMNTPAVLIQRDDMGRAVAIQIGYHHPPDRPWGIDVRGCPDPNCPWAPGESDWVSEPPFDMATVTCLCCGKSATIWRELDMPHIEEWGPANNHVFRSRFPLSHDDWIIAETVSKVERTAKQVKSQIRRLRKFNCNV